MKQSLRTLDDIESDYRKASERLKLKDNDYVFWAVGSRWIDGVKKKEAYLDSSCDERAAEELKIVTTSGTDIRDGTIMNIYLSGAICHMGHHTYTWSEEKLNGYKNEGYC